MTLTGVDTDGDGLDNRFDNNNSSVEGTSAYMGNGGSTSGDPTPGSITTVQRTAIALGCATERDWRCLPYALSCNIITFKLSELNNDVQLNWTVLCSQEADLFAVERSTDNQNFINIALIAGRRTVNENESYSAIDNINAINADIFYYRLRTTFRNGRESISNTILLRRIKAGSDIQILPNPVKDKIQFLIDVKKTTVARIQLLDGTGKIMNQYTEALRQGSNVFMYSDPSGYPIGIYYLRAEIDGLILTRKFSVIK